jgi:uncharacterized protein YaaW (UPF0174 family)
MQTIVYPEHKELLKKFTFDYGSFITHSEISKSIYIKEGTPKYYQIISKLKKSLIGKYLESYKNDEGIRGYRVLTPNETTDHAVKILTKSTKLNENAYKALKLAPIDKMDEEHQQKTIVICKKIEYILASNKGCLTEIKLLNKPTLNIRN